MFINKTSDGRNNLSGRAIGQLRKQRGLSQRALADQMQLLGIDLDKNAVQRIEAGLRFVTDIELCGFAGILPCQLNSCCRLRMKNMCRNIAGLFFAAFCGNVNLSYDCKNKWYLGKISAF